MKASNSSPILTLVLALVVSLLATAASAQQQLSFNVAVTGGIAPVQATMRENPNAPSIGATILTVHGFTETAASWNSMTTALFSHPATKFRVKRVIALDLPGHGQSPIPVLANGTFGALSIYDNVGVIIQVIDALRAQNLGPRVVMGHSMGGLAIQSVQETLLAGGSSLAKHGVLRAILLAPVPVANITQWAPASTTIPASYFRFDNGTYIVIDGFGALFGGGFTILSAPPPVPPAPPTVAPAALALFQQTGFAGLIGAEPQVTAGQLVGVIPNFPRPSARQGAFAPLKNGTLLTVIGFKEDVLTPAVLQRPLYEHLIGRQGLMYQEVTTVDSVHSMFIINPTGMLDQLFGFDDMF